MVVTADEARAIAKDAFIYGYPLVQSYKTLYKQAVDHGNSDYRAPFNEIASAVNIATPADTWVVTPNSDTPYSFLWMDLRAEPLVVTMPKIEMGRYYSAQLIDLQTFNFAYLGTRAFGNDGGDFLIAGPGWKGEQPKGVKAVIHCEMEVAYALFRTQLFDSDDLQNVRKIQSGYKVQSLSRYLGTSAPAAAPTIHWPKPSPQMDGPGPFFDYLNFLLQFCPVESSEIGLRQRFATFGIGAGLKFDFAALSPELQQEVTAGFADVGKDMAALQDQVNKNEVGSRDVFGTQAFLKNNYLYRFAAAKLGLYGNSRDEAIYPSYFTDADGKPLNATSKRYVLRFEKGQLPPAGAFWSFTMYDGKTQLLVANPLNRYLLNSTMLNSFKYGDDGSLTFYVQKDSPGADKESNWLPAPDGPFYCFMRIYMPKPEVIEGRWKNPPLVALAQQARQLPTSGIVESRLGKIELKNGYPTDETVKKLYDHIDFQRACQAYLWALPLMAMQEWQREHRETFGAANLDYVDYFTFVDKLGLLTANATTPYLMAFPNMKETGPLVMEVPPGATAGGITDFWQRPLTDSGQTGPDKGHGGKFLVLGPDDPDMKPPGFYVVRSPTINVWMAHRTLDPDLEIAKATAGRFRIYPYSQRDNPPPTRHLAPGGREWTGQQPSGLAYWEGLAKVVDEEPALERDRLVLGMLHPLGIEKGKAFNPDARQQQILIEAAQVGEVMARTIGFAKRFDGVKVWSGKQWDISLNLKETSQEAPYYTRFDERTSWFYEAVGVSVGMMGRIVGAGQVYLEASKDEKGRWLDGGETYRLHVPPNPPVAQFWSVTVYDNESRCFVDTGVQPDRSSRDNIVKNDDGSVDLYFGPNAPAGKPATNWIQTIPDKGWFTYFRLYGPTQRYFDRTWVLPDLEKLG